MAEAKEKVYIVLEGQKYSGKHRVYEGKNEIKGKLISDKFAESELFGDLQMALNGSKKHNIDPKIKVYVAPRPKKAEA